MDFRNAERFNEYKNGQKAFFDTKNPGAYTWKPTIEYEHDYEQEQDSLVPADALQKVTFVMKAGQPINRDTL